MQKSQFLGKQTNLAEKVFLRGTCRELAISNSAAEAEKVKTFQRVGYDGQKLSKPFFLHA